MRRAFSILEIIVGVALVVVISAAGFLALGRTRSGAQLDAASTEIVALLREGRQNALTSVSGTSWGVRFDNATSTRPSVSLFSSSTFSAGAVARTLPLPERVAYDSSVLAAGARLDVIFAQGTGRPASSSTIAIRTTDSARAYRIDVSAAGLVASALTTSGTSTPAALTVTGITPSSGPNTGSLSITSIAGTGFVSGATVRLTRISQSDIAGAGFTVSNATTMAGGSFNLSGVQAGTWTVTVTNPDTTQASCVACLTVTVPAPAPTVSGISANSGAQGAGQAFTITGTGFVTGASVAVSGTGVGVSGTSVTSATTITGTLTMDPAATTGARNVAVTNPDAQQGTCAGCFTVTAGPPAPTSASPTSLGQGAANQTVTVTGTRFVSGAAVTFSGTGVMVNSTSYVSSTTLTANVTLSAGAATGARNVAVTNPDAQQGTCSGCFTVNAAPAPASASPNSLAQGATGQTVTIAGTGFVSGASVAVSGTGVTVNSTSYVSATSLTANVTVSGGATAGSRNVTVTNPDGGTGTANAAFSVTGGSDLAAYWAFNDGSGTSAADGSGRGITGTLSGGPTWQATGCVSGGCLSFDGINDMMTIPGTYGTPLTTAATLSLWVKLNVGTPTDANKTGLAYLGVGTGGGYPNTHYSWTDGTLYLTPFRNARVDSVSPAGINRTQWHLLTITSAPGANGYKVYQNGTLVAQVAGESTISNVATAYLGKSFDSYYLNGSLDEVKVYSRALSASEVLARYMSEAPEINVAAATNGGTASANSTYAANYGVASVINGRRDLSSSGTGAWGENGGWNDGDAGVFPDWVQVDFNASYTIDEIDVVTLRNDFTTTGDPDASVSASSYGIRNFALQSWNGSSWVEITSVTDNNKAWRQFLITPVTTSKIRVNVTGSWDGASRLVEVEAWRQ